MKNLRGHSLTFVLLWALVCSPTRSRAGSGEDSFQEGLYQLLTVGDAGRALSSFAQAERRRSTRVGLEEILLQQVTCLEWTGQDDQLGEVIDKIGALIQTPAQDLGPSRLLPLAADLVLQLDLDGLRRASLWSRLGMSLPAADSVWTKRIKRLALAVGFAGHGAQILLVAEGDFSQMDPEDSLASLSQWLSDSLGAVSSILVAPNSARRLGAPAVVRKTRIRSVDVHPLSVTVPQGTFHLGLAKPDQRLLIVGDMGWVDFALAARAGRRLGLGADPRAKEMRSHLPERSTFWLSVAPSEFLRRLAELQGILGLSAHLPSLSGILISGSVASALRLHAWAWTVDDESARILADLARGSLALGSLSAQAGGRSGLAQSLQSLQVQSSGQQLSLSALFNLEQIQAVIRPAVTKP